jgi:hypothetical protein
MDVVRLAKFQSTNFLKNTKGQSAVEYILLLAVISTIGFSLINNRRFKEFVGGDKGLFAGLRKGIEYSYRYGRPLDDQVDFEEAMEFKYSSNKHDLYFNAKDGSSRFFTGTNPYGKP